MTLLQAAHRVTTIIRMAALKNMALGGAFALVTSALLMAAPVEGFFYSPRVFCASLSCDDVLLWWSAAALAASTCTEDAATACSEPALFLLFHSGLVPDLSINCSVDRSCIYSHDSPLTDPTLNTFYPFSTCAARCSSTPQQAQQQGG